MPHSTRSGPSDMDQWLDQVFDPVLDGNLDDLSDVKSLENRLRGGSDTAVDIQVSSIIIMTQSLSPWHTHSNNIKFTSMNVGTGLCHSSNLKSKLPFRVLKLLERQAFVNVTS